VQKVKKYINQMFQELPKSKRTTELKQEILQNMEERYRELAEQKMAPQKIEEQIINEIGTSQEIRENINLVSPKKQFIVIGIYLLLFVVSVFYISHSSLKFIPFAFSLAVFWGTILILNTISLLLNFKVNFNQTKGLRIIALIISIILMFLIAIFTMLPPSLWFTEREGVWVLIGTFILLNANTISGISGILFFLGSKKQ